MCQCLGSQGVLTFMLKDVELHVHPSVQIGT
jgi:hypothetical protein